jgi:hypothetical protein
MGLLWQCAVVAQTRVLDRGVDCLPGNFPVGGQPDGNSVRIQAPEGWIVIDTGRHPITRSGLPLARMRSKRRDTATRR